MHILLQLPSESVPQISQICPQGFRYMARRGPAGEWEPILPDVPPSAKLHLFLFPCSLNFKFF